MNRKAEILRLDIVLLGDFNPKIFTPAWFSALDLIGSVESDEANVEVIHKDVSIFSLDWFRLQITRDRFSIFTEQEAYFERLIDLVIHTFLYLSHTPIRAIGANWGGHFKADSIEEWNEFGHFLVPQNPWANIFEDSAVLKVEMMEKKPEKFSPDGNMQIRVEPSRQIIQGIFINLNDHYEIEPNKKRIGCSDIIKIFESKRDESKKKFQRIVTNLFNNFDGRKK